MLISEVYAAPQGEGEFAGTPSVFVRTTGCNLRCWYCDTPFTSWEPVGSQRSVADLVEEISSHNIEHVVLTGGEPMLPLEVIELTQRLRERSHFITIETAGTVFREVECDLMSLSPKLSNSTPSVDRSAVWAARHEQLRDRPQVIERLIAEYRYQFKFVVDRREDIAEIEQYLQRFPSIDRQRVWLMPQATSQTALSDKTSWLAPLAQQTGLRFSSRLHIAAHGNKRGT